MRARERHAILEQALHHLAFARETLMDAATVRRVLDAMGSWANAHRDSNGEKSEADIRRCVDRATVALAQSLTPPASAHAILAHKVRRDPLDKGEGPWGHALGRWVVVDVHTPSRAPGTLNAGTAPGLAYSDGSPAQAVLLGLSGPARVGAGRCIAVAQAPHLPTDLLIVACDGFSRRADDLAHILGCHDGAILCEPNPVFPS